MGMEAVRKAVEGDRKDQFNFGAVIRWTAADKYSYAALKTPIGWVTTSQYPNGHVPMCMMFDELLKILGRDETSNVAVATTWEPVRRWGEGKFDQGGVL